MTSCPSKFNQKNTHLLLQKLLEQHQQNLNFTSKVSLQIQVPSSTKTTEKFILLINPLNEIRTANNLAVFQLFSGPVLSAVAEFWFGRIHPAQSNHHRVESRQRTSPALARSSGCCLLKQMPSLHKSSVHKPQQHCPTFTVLLQSTQPLAVKASA